MCVNIEGVLRWPNKMLNKLFSDDSGQPRGGHYVRDWLKLQLAQGKHVLPMGEPCEGFSYLTGCPGHREELAAKSAPQIPVGGSRTVRSVEPKAEIEAGEIASVQAIRPAAAPPSEGEGG